MPESIRTETVPMSDREKSSLHKRMKKAIEWGIGDKEFRERFGKPRDDAMAMLRMKVERMK